jgi:TadE-like protein
MTQPPKTLMRDDRGQSLVEFALTLPMLLVVMFMITEFGRALYQYNVMAQATAFMTEAGLNTTGMTRSVSVVTNYNGTGTTVVRATADMPFRWILQGDLSTTADGSAPVSPGALNLHAETVMRAEGF